MNPMKILIAYDDSACSASMLHNEAHADAATCGTIEKIGEWGPDLVIVGTRERSALGRLIHGSVGRTLLSSAPCAVRIARAPHGHQIGGLRIILAVDGSDESNAAVRSVASRCWPAGSVIKTISVVDTHATRTNSGGIAPSSGRREQKEDIARGHARDATKELTEAGLSTQFLVASGDPSEEIIGAAGRWGADAIFIGARGHGMVERMLMGSVSYAVATRAACSVEVVRRQYDECSIVSENAGALCTHDGRQYAPAFAVQGSMPCCVRESQTR
jgi:nucleotide-binding universal stress UspA family protein